MRSTWGWRQASLAVCAWLLATAVWAGDQQLYLELVVNELASGRVVAVSARDGRYFVAREELQALGVSLQQAGAGDPLALDAIPGLQSHYQQDTQSLHLRLPSAWLPHQELGDSRLSEPVLAQTSLGALLNYDVYYSDSEAGGRYASAWLEQRFFDSFGVVSNTGIWHQADSAGASDTDGYTRYDTQWRYNQQDSMTSYMAGDLVSAALTWSSAVRLGGAQVGRNFALRPDLITYPLPRFSGDAALPSSVDLFIDNAKVSSERLNPGPFTLHSVPFISGAGEATVVTTDVQGRRVATSVPFYVTDRLLQKGLLDYSLAAGKLRKDYGADNFSYGSFAGSASLRYGLSDAVTLETHGESGADLKLAGLGGTFAVGRWGTLGTSMANSRFQGDSGQQYSLGYSYYSSRFGLAFQHIQRSSGFADLSQVSALENRVNGSFLAERSDQLTLSLNSARMGTLGLGYFQLRDRQGQRTRLLNLSWSRSVFGNASLYASFNRLLGEPGYSAQMQLLLPFDLYSNVTIGIERSSQGRYTERVNYSRSVPSQGGLGYNLGYAGGASDFYQADAAWRTPYAQLQGGLYSDAGRDTYWGGLSGSWVAMDGALFASNRIDDAFVLVNTDGYPKVPVRFEHQLLGETDRNGHLLVPWVPSYYHGQYEIDLLGLPANVQAPEVEQRVAVHQGSGALLAFSLRPVVAASIVLIDSRGGVLPRGTPVEHLESGQQGVVGWDGLVYFEGLQAYNALRVRFADGRQCQAHFELDTQVEEIALVGPLTCRLRREP